MSDTNESPPLADSVREVQGSFPNDAALQDAIGRLTLAGFDRADLSLPDEQHDPLALPTDGAENPTDEIDKAQLRTMGTGMAGYAGAVAASGAILATGGAAAVAVAAAAAVGVGAALTAETAGQVADKAGVEEHDARGATGKLILAVRARTPDRAVEIATLMKEAGATATTDVSRENDMLTAGVSSASWTGA